MEGCILISYIWNFLERDAYFFSFQKVPDYFISEGITKKYHLSTLIIAKEVEFVNLLFCRLRVHVMLLVYHKKIEAIS